MDKKKKVILVVAILAAAGGIFFYLNKKKKDAAKGGTIAGGDTGTGFDSSKCQEVEEATGGGKGVYLAIKGKKGSEARKLANSRGYKVGMMVSVDGGAPTKIIKVWRDSNKDIAALKLENGVANGNQVCIVG